jgi:hypothetical protein
VSPTLEIAQGYLRRAIEKLNEDPLNEEKQRAVATWRAEVDYHVAEIKKAAN